MVDIERYMGTWYEVGRSDNSFQRHCIEGARAEYKLLEGGWIQVVNTCRSGKGEKRTKGYAWRTKRDSVLSVSFLPLPRFLLPFAPIGKYEILYVSEGYDLAVVVSGKNYWLLSRTRTVPLSVHSFLMKKVNSRFSKRVSRKSLESEF